MTFGKVYSFRIEGKKIPKKVNDDLSLYDACKKTIGISGGIVLREGDLVGFFCSYNGLVKAGFKACKFEREAINNFHLGI